MSAPDPAGHAIELLAVTRRRSTDRRGVRTARVQCSCGFARACPTMSAARVVADHHAVEALGGGAPSALTPALAPGQRFAVWSDAKRSFLVREVLSTSKKRVEYRAWTIHAIPENGYQLEHDLRAATSGTSECSRLAWDRWTARGVPTFARGDVSFETFQPFSFLGPAVRAGEPSVGNGVAHFRRWRVTLEPIEDPEGDVARLEALLASSRNRNNDAILKLHLDRLRSTAKEDAWSLP